jgi:hypothetical protein
MPPWSAYRRAMIDEQNPEARRENLRVSFPAPSLRCSKRSIAIVGRASRRWRLSMSTFILAVRRWWHGQNVGGRRSCQNRGSTHAAQIAYAAQPGMRCHCRTTGQPRQQAAMPNGRSGCTADDRPGRRRVTGTTSSTGAIVPRRLPSDARSESLFAPCALWRAKSRRSSPPKSQNHPDEVLEM